VLGLGFIPQNCWRQWSSILPPSALLVSFTLSVGIVNYLRSALGTLQDQLAQHFPPRPGCPKNCSYSCIAHLYEQFMERMEATRTSNPLGVSVHVFAENFPYLVKLEFFDKKVNRWVEAKAARAIEQLKDKRLDESRYRPDHSRARSLFWILDIISQPESIHHNLSPRVRGEHVYLRRYVRDDPRDSYIKAATTTTRATGQVVVVTSFWTDEDWVGSYAKHPPFHPK
jgi:hypothetical protein